MEYTPRMTENMLTAHSAAVNSMVLLKNVAGTLPLRPAGSEKLPVAVKIARKTHAIVMQNIVFALGVKILVLILSTFGFANMWAAVFADVGVSVIAILNAMRTMKT